MKIKSINIVLAMLLSAVTLHAQFTKASLQASGLTCAMCTKAIDNALKSLPFVGTVQPDIKNSSFSITFKSEPDIDALRLAVEDAGFFIAKLGVTGNFDHLQVGNDSHVNIGGKTFHFLAVKDQVLDGEKQIVVVDKYFVTPNAFKKYSAQTAMQCIKTGRAAGCCEKGGLAAGTRIYHVTI